MSSSALVSTGLSPAQVNVLTQTTPKEVIKTRKGKGGKIFKYVEHAWVTRQLNEAFNWAWSWEILQWQIITPEDPQEVFVLGKLTVHGPDGKALVKTQFGTSVVKRDRDGTILSIGDDLKAASSDALKKCASLLGLALDLYSDDEDVSNGHHPPPKSKSWPGKLVEALLRAGIAQHTKHAISILNLSPFGPNASEQDVVEWATAYRRYRVEEGLDVDDAVKATNKELFGE